jgi:hypothetical protein
MRSKKGNAGPYHTAKEAARMQSIGRYVNLLRASGVTFHSVSLAALAVAGFLKSTELGACHQKTLLRNAAYRELLEPLVLNGSLQPPQTIEADNFEKEVLKGRIKTLSMVVKCLQDQQSSKSAETAPGIVSSNDFESVCSALERVLVHFKEFIVTDAGAGVVVDPLNKKIVASREIAAPFFKWLDKKGKTS